jgi:hypothetical protein
LVREARRLLSGQLGVVDSEITTVAVEPRDWPDTGLGCPEPGRAYAQVITPGYRIVLGHGGERYVYHAGMGNVIPCPSDRA